ncbi:HSP20 family protein [Amycolatopsis arida]|uniref:HSP20 family protein n=1 Tax=Amycolatopsis arida TaxID=587909 RepID=A0A1I5ZU77_9PSEU|nr:Hsp20/alpha crystallin family protein [Amycolatopsis arida]TDX89369.1 Hsp20/alpha crystallin family protein [Amycolatopsis arida]SFQ59972.1 HSP20 family protein [Amycolatopsis arida]
MTQQTGTQLRRKDDGTVDLVGSELTTTGERIEKECEGWFRHRTRRTGRFPYQVRLPHDVDADHINATLADGVLTVRAPKSEAAKPRRIAISAT